MDGEAVLELKFSAAAFKPAWAVQAAVHAQALGKLEAHVYTPTTTSGSR